MRRPLCERRYEFQVLQLFFSPNFFYGHWPTADIFHAIGQKEEVYVVVCLQ